MDWKLGIGEVEADQRAVVVDRRHPWIPAQAEVEGQLGITFQSSCTIQGRTEFAQIGLRPLSWKKLDS